MRKYVDVDIAEDYLVRGYSLDEIPTADVEPVRHGHREKALSVTGNWYARCSICKTRVSAVKQRYCPHCGAKMDGKEADG